MGEPLTSRRCAIYVRKSSEEGLDMSYNSLEAQSDACAAYIASQRHEGWVRLQQVYEDGGYSGGTLERPGLQQLLADVASGKIDIIVVYKIDRLTRSLTDFAKLNDLLDRNKVSFVAVTQQFNTSTSMGRLTLNVLLSFAQFEREVAGERIRDKVAASKKKGMWMGGPVPLGYAVRDRKLIIVPDEAEIVRGMFKRYLELRSVHLLQRELEEQGVRSRLRHLGDGRMLGGQVLGRGAIAHMLKNPLYVGQVRFQNQLHAGQHDQIVERELFDSAQTALAAQSPGEDARAKRKIGAMLQGIVFDENSNRLTPNFSKKNGVRYHYYTSAKRLKAASDDLQGIRVPAGDLERLVLVAVADRLRDGTKMQQWGKLHAPASELPKLLTRCSGLGALVGSKTISGEAAAREVIERVQVSKSQVHIRLSASGLRKNLGLTDTAFPRIDNSQSDVWDRDHDASSLDPLEITIVSHLLRCGKQVKLVLGQDTSEPARTNPHLINMVVKARLWFDGLASARYLTLRSIASEENCDKSYVSRLLSIAFLAPDIIERILTGEHQATLTPERLRKACPLPVRWEDQRALLLD